jgi:hypothetical protein
MAVLASHAPSRCHPREKAGSLIDGASHAGLTIRMEAGMRDTRTSVCTLPYNIQHTSEAHRLATTNVTDTSNEGATSGDNAPMCDIEAA